MTKELFEKLKQLNEEHEEIIQVDNLWPFCHDRTLLYGYTCERKTFHVYIKDRDIYTVIYDVDYSTNRPKNMKRVTVCSNYDYVPDKRLYPERCDYNFCRLLKRKGIDLPFTSWCDNINNNNQKYYGFTLDDIAD